MNIENFYQKKRKEFEKYYDKKIKALKKEGDPKKIARLIKSLEKQKDKCEEVNKHDIDRHNDFIEAVNLKSGLWPKKIINQSKLAQKYSFEKVIEWRYESFKKDIEVLINKIKK